MRLPRLSLQLHLQLLKIRLHILQIETVSLEEQSFLHPADFRCCWSQAKHNYMWEGLEYSAVKEQRADRNVQLLVLAAHEVLHDFDGLADVFAHLLHFVQAVLVVFPPPPCLWAMYLLPRPARQLDVNLSWYLPAHLASTAGTDTWSVSFSSSTWLIMHAQATHAVPICREAQTLVWYMARI